MGAYNELKHLFSSKSDQESVHNELAEQKIICQFIPPRSPQFGGMWEAGVKSVKHHLYIIIGKSYLTYKS